MCVDLRHLAVALVRDVSGERVEHHAAERIDVGAGVDLLSPDLLGRHVVGRSDEVARLREPSRRGRALRQAEVGEVGVLSGVRVDEDVGGLHVAMDEAVVVRRVERRADLLDDRDRPGELQAAVADYQRAQVRALDPAHADEEEPFGLARLVDGEHVRVLDQRPEL